MFDVFVSKSLTFLFPFPESTPSPYSHEGELYYFLGATFFAWAARTIPRAIAANAVPAHFADILEDMRLHLLHTNPDALTEAATLLSALGAIPLPQPPAPVEPAPPKRKRTKS